MKRRVVGTLRVLFVAVLCTLDAPAAGAQGFAVSAVDLPRVDLPVAASCDVSISPLGLTVRWRAFGSDADRFVVERSLDGEVFHWRGADDGAIGTFMDADPESRGADAIYRMVQKRRGEVLSSSECTWVRGHLGRFECSVSANGDGYAIEWSGGPTGNGLDYVIERDVNPDDVFHWRGRVAEQRFQDEGSRASPVYRVTARFDAEPALSVECALGAMAVRAPDAAFVCPVPGASFVDTFGADRDGGARRHQGVDMFAATGTPVLAPEDGEVVRLSNRLGGLSFALSGDSGTYYYGAHLDTFVGEDRRVAAGELVGTVGNTGNARTTPPHLHFQIHPDGRGTPAANPTNATRAACN